MKNLILKLLVFGSALLFIDYIIMLAVGCTTCLFGFTSSFYDCNFCIIGKLVLLISFLILLLILLPDMKVQFKKYRY
ncbi:hypothetical protein [uncultured Lutibacter sp.]|uniref:hypothetical protein n=1 Tax=Lutibacter sp. TaxID=1925666 RepID=UPI002608FA9C|nr:hypothetical protein [uncultured Lutibacter sp.]